MQERVCHRWGTQTNAIDIAEQNGEVTVSPPPPGGGGGGDCKWGGGGFQGGAGYMTIYQPSWNPPPPSRVPLR